MAPCPCRGQKVGGSYSCLVSIIAIVVIGFGVTAFSLRQFIYNHSFNAVMGSGEVSIRSFLHDINSILCESYDVQPFFPADVFRVKGAAKVDSNQRVVRKRSTKQLDPRSIFIQNSFYLLEDSFIYAKACKRNEAVFADSVVELLLFKGDHSWHAWLAGKCYYCPIKRVTVPSNHRCPNNTANLKFTVNVRDTYYVALSTMQDQSEDFQADLEVNCTTFDLKHADHLYSNSKKCKVGLKFGEHIDVVLRFADKSALSSFGSQCTPRIWIWVCVFAVVPAVIIGITLSICGYVAYNDRKHSNMKDPNSFGDSETPKTQLDNRDPLLGNKSTGKIQV